MAALMLFTLILMLLFRHARVVAIMRGAFIDAHRLFSRCCHAVTMPRCRHAVARLIIATRYAAMHAPLLPLRQLRYAAAAAAACCQALDAATPRLRHFKIRDAFFFLRYLPCHMLPIRVTPRLQMSFDMPPFDVATRGLARRGYAINTTDTC